MSIPDRIEARKKVREEEIRRVNEAREKVDTVVRRECQKIDLRDIDDSGLRNYSYRLAKKLRNHNPEPLAKYIRLMIIYLTTT